MFDERSWEIRNWNCQQVRVEISVDIIDCVCQNSWRNR